MKDSSIKRSTETKAGNHLRLLIGVNCQRVNVHVNCHSHYCMSEVRLYDSMSEVRRPNDGQWFET